MIQTILLAAACTMGGDAGPKLVADPVRIWNEGPHNAFTDLLHHGGQWYCVFREGTDHAKGAGKIRVIVSREGVKWASLALIESKDVDLRDPHLCVTPDGHLMINGGAAVPPTRDPVKDHYSWVSFSRDAGSTWSPPERVGESWHWLWRVTWHKGKAFGVAYHWAPDKERKYEASLFAAADGKAFERVSRFDLTQATEATLRFDGDTLLCLQRRDGKPNSAHLGVSAAPYAKWTWHDLGRYFGGPNFIQGKDGTWWAAGRIQEKGKYQTALCRLDVKDPKLTPVLILPSGGDNSYPGLAWHGDELWISYYSGHEGKTSIYLAKVRTVR